MTEHSHSHSHSHPHSHPEHPGGPAIVAKSLAVVLGSYAALADVNFSLPRGGFLAVLGPNGGGKTTLVRCLMGLIPPSSGSVGVFGMPAGKLSPRQTGYVPQIKTLDRRFPALPIEVVVSGLRGSWPWRIKPEEEAKAMEALRRTGMDEKARRPVGGLSGGELQRVFLSRALVREPDLVILDEPATGMDAMGEADMYHLLEHYREDHEATVLMITHDWDVAQHHATHVLLLNRRQEAFGPPAEVLTSEHLRRAFGHVGHRHPMILPEHHDHA